MLAFIRSLLLLTGAAAIFTSVIIVVYYKVVVNQSIVIGEFRRTKDRFMEQQHCLESFKDCIDHPSSSPGNKQDEQIIENDHAHHHVGPKVVWLMSFPNSGTSFTIHATRHLSNTTTATNYALEGDILDRPGIPAIPGPEGEQGPFLELVWNFSTTMPRHYILTKTHCAGFCDNCSPDAYVETPRSFQRGCQSGEQGVWTKQDGLQKRPVTYSMSLVKKAIHLIRHPLDNVVARFHLFRATEKVHYIGIGNRTVSVNHPNNQTGFQDWCKRLNRQQRPHMNKFRWIDRRLLEFLDGVPCQPELYRYVQWHNLAFAMSRDLALPTQVVHYEDYSHHLDQTMTRIMNFLELPSVAQSPMEFQSGKSYKDYYTKEQKVAMRRYIQEAATVETWQNLKHYEFD